MKSSKKKTSSILTFFAPNFCVAVTSYGALYDKSLGGIDRLVVEIASPCFDAHEKLKKKNFVNFDLFHSPLSAHHHLIWGTIS